TYLVDVDTSPSLAPPTSLHDTLHIYRRSDAPDLDLLQPRPFEDGIRVAPREVHRRTFLAGSPRTAVEQQENDEEAERRDDDEDQIGRAQVCNPVTDQYSMHSSA